MNVLLVDRWVIRLPNALRVSRDPSSLPSHHLRLPNTLQDLVVILRLDDEVPITIRATPFPTPQDSSSTLRILSIREDSPSREILLLVVQDLRGSQISRGSDVVFMPTEVAMDDSRSRHVSTTCQCKMPRIIQI
ncbi:hypothetical protein ACFXTH_008045 [Malus domestica]